MAEGEGVGQEGEGVGEEGRVLGEEQQPGRGGIGEGERRRGRREERNRELVSAGPNDFED